MAGAETALQGEGLPGSLWRMVEPRLAAALSALELAAEFSAVLITADDLPGDDSAWYRLLPGEGGTGRPTLALTCHADSFCRHQPLHTTVYPVRAIWDQLDAPPAARIPDPDVYSPERTDSFLFHHLLTVRDLRRGELQGGDIPDHLQEAFAAVWAVSVDGRLARRQLPGYGLAERRNHYSRLFSTGGILLPEHWQVFQAVWDGALLEQSAILGVTRQLPRL